MKYIAILGLLVLCSKSVFALTGEEILNKMDGHRDYKTITYTGTMTIHIDEQTRVKNMTSQGMEAEKTRAIVEFTNPEDQGTKFLIRTSGSISRMKRKWCRSRWSPYH
jgi:outer membrane lipoprotein-sorting protein